MNKAASMKAGGAGKSGSRQGGKAKANTKFGQRNPKKGSHAVQGNGK